MIFPEVTDGLFNRMRIRRSTALVAKIRRRILISEARDLSRG
jgi:hypothetical protein